MDNSVLTMGITRVIFGSLNLIFAFLMLRSNQVETAFKLNSYLGAIGPFVFLFVSSIGVMSLAGKLPVLKTIAIIIGVILILWGTK